MKYVSAPPLILLRGIVREHAVEDRPATKREIRKLHAERDAVGHTVALLLVNIVICSLLFLPRIRDTRDNTLNNVVINVSI